MDTPFYIREIKRRWPYILLLTIIGLIAGILWGISDRNAFREEQDLKQTFWVQEITLGKNLESNGSVNFLTAGARFISDDVINLAWENLPDPYQNISPQDYKHQSRVVARADVSLIVISTIAADAETANILSETLGQASVAFISSLSQKDLQGRVTSTENNIVINQQELSDSKEELSRIRSERAAIPIEESGTSLSQSLAVEEESIRRRIAVIENDLSLLFEKRTELLEESTRPSVLTFINRSVPFEVGEREFNSRVEEGSRGLNFYNNSGSVPGVKSDASTVIEIFNKPVVRGIGAAASTLMMAIAAIMAWLTITDNVLSSEQLEQGVGNKVIGKIPEFPASERNLIHAIEKPRSNITEAYRSVRTSLIYFSGIERDSSEEALVVLITSAEPQAGKTTTSVNLSTLFAEDGKKTLLINCDYRLPRINELFNLSKGNDIQKMMGGDDGRGELFVLSNFSDGAVDNPTEVIRKQKEAIKRYSKEFDIIILDTIPINSTSDTEALLVSADLIVMVAKSRASKTRPLIKAVDKVRGAASAPIISSGKEDQDNSDRKQGVIAGIVVVGDDAEKSYGYYYSDEAETSSWKNPLSRKGSNREASVKAAAVGSVELEQNYSKSPELDDIQEATEVSLDEIQIESPGETVFLEDLEPLSSEIKENLNGVGPAQEDAISPVISSIPSLVSIGEEEMDSIPEP